MTNEEAKEVARDWYNGEHSALYQFYKNGIITPLLLKEIGLCQKEAIFRKQQLRLKELCDYVTQQTTR